MTDITRKNLHLVRKQISEALDAIEDSGITTMESGKWTIAAAAAFLLQLRYNDISKLDLDASGNILMYGKLWIGESGDINQNNFIHVVDDGDIDVAIESADDNDVTVTLKTEGDRVIEATGSDDDSHAKITMAEDRVEIAGDDAANPFIEMDGNDWTDKLHSFVDTGSFTPELSGVTTAGSHTYQTQSGKYTRIADTIFFSIHIIIEQGNLGTMAGILQITGLPATSVTGFNAPCYVADAQGFRYTNIGAYVSANNTRIILRDSLGTLSGTTTNLQANDVDDTSVDVEIRVAGIYYAA